MPDLDLGSNEVKAQLERNLETLLTQCSHQYTKGFSMVTPVPDAISRHWTTQLRLFDTSSAQRMTQAFLTALEDAKSPEESNQMVTGEALAQQKRLSNIRTYSEAQYQTWMELMNRPDYPHYLFISERSDTTCDNCRCRHGILYEEASLAEILPPLHPNCLCILIALDSQMVVQYRHRTEFFLDMLNDTFTLDDPWSFEHWMNILGTATLIVGAVKFGTKAALGADDLIDDVGRTSIDDIADDVGRAFADDSLLDDVITETDQGVLDDIVEDVLEEASDNLIRPVVGDDLLGMTTEQMDDTLKQVAGELGDITSIQSADIKNELALIQNPTFEPPYIDGTQTYQIILQEETRFVRVYSEGSPMINQWVVRANDIVGLTPLEIKDKLALPHIPECICDVYVPSGTLLEVSAANGILGNTGGGIQFFITEKPIPNWFNGQRFLI